MAKKKTAKKAKQVVAKKKTTKAKAAPKAVELPEGEVPMLKIGGVEIPLTAEQLKLLSKANQPAAPAPTPQVESKPKPVPVVKAKTAAAAVVPKAKGSPEPKPSATRPALPPKVPKVTDRKPGQMTIDIPTRAKDINTARVTKPGGYHKLRYALEFLEEKHKKGLWKKEEHEPRLVETLNALTEPLGDATQNLVAGILRVLDTRDDLSPATAKTMRDFRRKFL